MTNNRKLRSSYTNWQDRAFSLYRALVNHPRATANAVIQEESSNNLPDHYKSAISFREKRYLPVKAIFPPPLMEFLKVYLGVLLVNNSFSKDRQCPMSLSIHGDPGLDAVLEWIRPQVCRLVGLELTPTYSMARLYSKDEVLVRHRDREACEISLTVTINIPGGMDPSPLILKPPNRDEVKIEMLEGDGCVYAGTEVEHWRNAFPGHGYIQLFLHYITRYGPHFPMRRYDGREFLGLP
jgi:hypothetical protein